MKRVIFALVACAASLLPQSALSDQVSGLYETQVPVISQGVEARKAGLVDALQGVLVKLSGMSDVARQRGLAEALAAPERYVEQFRYVAPEGAGADGLSLWVRFDGRALEQLLRAKGLPVWGATRPAALVWLSVDEKGQRTLVGAGDKSAPAMALQAAATRRGLPVRLPLMDLEDRGRIVPADVWGGFAETIQAASMRYRTQAVLTGALARESDGQWRGRWTLYRDGAVANRWDATGPLEQVVNAGIDPTTDELARAFSAPVDGAGAGATVVQVTGVRTLEDFMRVSNYLRGLGGVSGVQPMEVSDDRVLFSVALQGTVQAFTQAVRLGDVLAPVQEPAAAAAELSYRLVQ